MTTFLLERAIKGMEHFRTFPRKPCSVQNDLALTLFLAHLSTTCSRGAFRMVMCPLSIVRCESSTISLNIFSSQTTEPIWTKLGRNVPLEVLFKTCSQNLIPSKTLVYHCNEIEFFKQFFENLLLEPLV